MHMADLPPYPDTSDETSDRQSASGTPRWMAMLGIAIAIVLVLLLVILHLTGTLGASAH
jgi:hypothetical protein